MSKIKVLIIGGGSTGLATALEIAKSKKAEVMVLEKSYVGSGQTGQCCGLVRNFYNVPEMIFSAHFSMKKIIAICRNNPHLKYEKKGLLVLDNIKNKKTIQKNVKLLKSLGVKTDYLEGSEINKIHPFIVTKGICAGYDIDAGYINPQLMIDHLKKQCINAGVEIHEQSEVFAIEKNNDGKFIVSTKERNFEVDKVFNATAGYSNSINRMLNFSLPIKTIKINNTFYRLPFGPQKYLMAIADFENCFYDIPHEDFIDVSTMVLDLNKTIDMTKEEEVFDQKVIKQNKSLLAKRIIGAERASILGGFGSNIDVTSDYYPILSAIDEVPNYYCAAGFSGTGFKHFPMIGKIMRQIILEEKYTYEKLVKFFRYDRFKSSKRRENVCDSYFIQDN